MKKIRTTALLVAVGASLAAQVGVNILTPHSTSALQVQSPPGSFRGFLTPSVTTVGRMGITIGTVVPADGLLVYDTDHKMHYAYQSASNKWISHTPFILSSPNFGASSVPSGVITTPAVASVFSVGINKQSPSAELDVVGNSVVSGNSSVGGNVNVAGSMNIGAALTVGGNPVVPPGTIVMFHGATIPAGWAICNGNNGTPDLRGRFIVASGQATAAVAPGDISPAYTTNSTGGENRHILTKSEIPKHFHQASGDGSTLSAQGGYHNHNVTPSGQGTGAQRASGNSGGLATDGTATIGTTSNTHSHPNSDFSGHVGDGSLDGLSNQSHENRPQYYVLTFIMKL